MEDNYERIKCEIRKKPISLEQLEELKERFEEDIRSVRLMSHIQSIDDLLECLERRDVNKNDALKNIAEVIGDNGIIKKLANDQSSSEQGPVNMVNEYAMERLREDLEDQLKVRHQQNVNEINGFIPSLSYKAGIPVLQNNPVNSALFSGINKTAIHKLIATEIGRKWRDFGRGLNIREGEMDDLQASYPRDLKTQVIKMLEMFEEPGREDPKKHVIIICNALIDCRRRDLSEKIQEILTR